MSLPVIAFDEMHPPRLVTCHGCGQERLSRADHPGLAGESSLCQTCLLDVRVMREAVAALTVSHPALAAQLMQRADRMEE